MARERKQGKQKNKPDRAGKEKDGVKRNKRQCDKKQRIEEPMDVVLDRNGIDTGSLFQVDGSLLEGGGQVLRNTVAYAMLLGKPVLINHIRAGRDRPGLRAQHLTGIELVNYMCRGRLIHAHVGSTWICFVPGKVPARALSSSPSVSESQESTSYSFNADTRTAGSICLVIQSALPCLLFLPDHRASACTTLRGGTNAIMAPLLDYAQHIFLPILSTHMNLSCRLELVKRGFYPHGGGEARLYTQALDPGTCLPAIQITQRGHLTKIWGYACVCGHMKKEIGDRAAAAATQILAHFLVSQPVRHAKAKSNASKTETETEEKKVSVGDMDTKKGSDPYSELEWLDFRPEAPVDVNGVNLFIESRKEPLEMSRFPGAYIFIVAETDTHCLLGASALLDKKNTPEDIGCSAANDLIKDLERGGAVDRHLQDQLVIYMALAQGRSTIACGAGPLELHTETALHWAKEIAGAKVDIQHQEDGDVILSVQGIGLSPESAHKESP